MKKVTLDAQYPVCSIERSLEVLGERWTFLVLREALSGSTRFGEFTDALGISTDLLSDRLATLVNAGIMNKRPYQQPGQRVRYEYHLTPAGEELRIVLGALQQWGDQHSAPATGPSAERRSRRTGEQLDVAFVDKAGNAVGLDDVTFVAT
ncbi:HxlR family transcriptional regulator [Asanoa ishikariensis]|uniref:Transcriptional regulator, HxlR family n=1 Tax=Asanoa ishikariensis TaxID=137265 RepID=A0A1H3TQR1_9ACTN|nr:helix-turn-helix domain-containing protein [Asanoa ishikariensis]GIF67334.1 HxlR family transcriptional regulator [Asanoa ishikariensis]SDZ52633.1 transcriptional regulator, HxlR family [Asanoa ishikariensis]